MLNRLTLVLNCAYEPVNVVSAKRALTLVMGGKATVEIPSKHYIRTSRLVVQLPSVIKLLKYRRVPRHSRAVSRKSIFLRDRYTWRLLWSGGVAAGGSRNLWGDGPGRDVA